MNRRPLFTLSGSLCIALLALTACASGTQGSPPATSAPTTRAASTPAPSTPAPSSSPATTAASVEPTNLTADASVRQGLLAAFTAFRSNAANAPGFAAIAPSAVGGITPGTLYYAFDPATGTYWAVATFSATKAASQTSAYAGFQDGGNKAVFMRPSSGPWQVKSAGACLSGLPVAVATTLALTASPSPMCPSGVPAS
jgi:glucose/arabinose dehydrogenase